MKLPRCLQPFADRIAEVSDERSTEEGYWVYLAAGWWSPEDETHCIHEDNPQQCVYYLRTIERCPCCNGGQDNE